MWPGEIEGFDAKIANPRPDAAPLPLLMQSKRAPCAPPHTGSAVVFLISSIDSSAVTLCTFTSEISAW